MASNPNANASINHILGLFFSSCLRCRCHGHLHRRRRFSSERRSHRQSALVRPFAARVVAAAEADATAEASTEASTEASKTDNDANRHNSGSLLAAGNASPTVGGTDSAPSPSLFGQKVSGWSAILPTTDMYPLPVHSVHSSLRYPCMCIPSFRRSGIGEKEKGFSSS